MPSRSAPLLAAVSLLLAPSAALAGPRCVNLEAAFAGELADVVCVESIDLTTANPATTPQNNLVPGVPAGTWPAFAFTPQTDRNVISPDAPDRTPITKAVPGIQLMARVADDPTGEARFLLRLPDGWNGRLVVAGASGTRSEFNGDFAWSDYVVQEGYAYASQNKGIMNFRLVGVSVTPPSDPLACRLNPSSAAWVHFYDNDDAKPFTEWQGRIHRPGRGAGPRRREGGVRQLPSRWTYAVGTSNGGYQVRRALEEAPDLFDGGLDWEGTFVRLGDTTSSRTSRPLSCHFPDYVASGFNPALRRRAGILAAGFPPDIVHRDALGQVTCLALVSTTRILFWEVTQCQWQKRLDPGYDTYGAGPGNYDYLVADGGDSTSPRASPSFTTTGKIKKSARDRGRNDGRAPPDPAPGPPLRRRGPPFNTRKGTAFFQRRAPRRTSPQFRLYEVQNGNHIENYRNTFSELEYLQPYAQAAFEALVRHVETGAPLPPDQCIPRGSGGAIAAAPAQPGRCAELLAP